MYKNTKIKKIPISFQKPYKLLQSRFVSKLHSSMLLKLIMGWYMVCSSIYLFDIKKQLHTLELLTMILITLFSFSILRINIRNNEITEIDGLIIVTTTLFIIFRLIRDISQSDTMNQILLMLS